MNSAASERVKNPLEQDLDHILAHTAGLWPELRGGDLFITGGTGFFGCWLLESFLHANRQLELGARATVLTRNPQAFVDKVPHIACDPAIRLVDGDVRSFEFPSGHFSHVVHAATEANVTLARDEPRLMFDTIVDGTRRVLDFAVKCGAGKLLLTSSGAVYGKQLPELSHVPEDYSGAPDPSDPGSAYGEGKRAAELLCAIYVRDFGLTCPIARCFAFVGPYLPLDAHFAVGNFIRDGLAGESIRVAGDGTPQRSYLYAADLAIWLWTILFRGKAARAYNVGSESSVSVRTLAEMVAQACGSDAGVSVMQKPVAASALAERSRSQRYVPSVQRASSELGLEQCIGLEDAIRRTLCFYKTPPCPPLQGEGGDRNPSERGNFNLPEGVGCDLPPLVGEGRGGVRGSSLPGSCQKAVEK